jgi:hypothetical protein
VGVGTLCVEKGGGGGRGGALSRDVLSAAPCYFLYCMQTGEICLDILKTAWSPAWTLTAVCQVEFGWEGFG